MDFETIKHVFFSLSFSHQMVEMNVGIISSKWTRRINWKTRHFMRMISKHFKSKIKFYHFHHHNGWHANRKELTVYNSFIQILRIFCKTKWGNVYEKHRSNIFKSIIEENDIHKWTYLSTYHPYTINTIHNIKWYSVTIARAFRTRVEYWKPLWWRWKTDSNL